VVDNLIRNAVGTRQETQLMRYFVPYREEQAERAHVDAQLMWQHVPCREERFCMARDAFKWSGTAADQK